MSAVVSIQPEDATDSRPGAESAAVVVGCEDGEGKKAARGGASGS